MINAELSPNSELWQRVDALVSAKLHGELTESQLLELERLLRGSEEARDLYVELIEMSVFLPRALAVDESPAAAMPFDAPLPTLSTPHYPLPANFIGGPVFSYMVATVVLCLMLLGAWAYKISHIADSQLVNNSPKSTTSGPEKLVFVGRITGLKDCQWSDPATGTIIGAAVALDRRYALASGLMEITYKSGARVILEGPCTYKVESDVGGYLELGKLTARIEHQGPAASAASAKPQAVFSVKTPTAVVTDLGTEFGVEVDERGDTVSYVFQGTIKVQGLAASVASGATEKVLHENESIRVSRVRETHQNSTSTEVVRFTPTVALPEFIREMPRIPMSGGSLSIMNSADFPWKYEMDVDPAAQDLDGNSINDWNDFRDGTTSTFGGVMHMRPNGKNEYPSYYSATNENTIWSNISHATGFTLEIRVKCAGTKSWHEYTGVMYVRLSDENTDEYLSDLVIANEATLCDHVAKIVIDNNANDDDYHVFRVAQKANSRQYYVWRDGKLIYTRNGLQDKNGPLRIGLASFGNLSGAAGPSEVDYVRLTAGAYAPAPPATSQNQNDNNKAK